MPGDIELRMGAAADTSAIARLMRVAGGGLFEQLLDGVIPGMDVEALLALAIDEPDGTYCHGNAVIAEHDGTCCGLALAYPFHAHGLPKVVRTIVPPPRLAPVRRLVEAQAPPSLYLLSIAVAPRMARRGMARLMLQAAARLAAAKGFDRLSLHVWAGNEPAMRLYRSMGFRVEDTLSVERTPHLRWRGPVALCVAETAGLLGNAG